jgi:hypothetical protein
MDRLDDEYGVGRADEQRVADDVRDLRDQEEG